MAADKMTARNNKSAIFVFRDNPLEGIFAEHFLFYAVWRALAEPPLYEGRYPLEIPQYQTEEADENGYKRRQNGINSLACAGVNIGKRRSAPYENNRRQYNSEYPNHGTILPLRSKPRPFSSRSWTVLKNLPSGKPANGPNLFRCPRFHRATDCRLIPGIQSLRQPIHARGLISL